MGEKITFNYTKLADTECRSRETAVVSGVRMEQRARSSSGQRGIPAHNYPLSVSAWVSVEGSRLRNAAHMAVQLNIAVYQP